MSNEVFVDCGGYIGDTVLEFVKFSSNNYKKIYYLEPNVGIFQQAEKNLSNVKNIVYILAGAGESVGRLGFSGSGDSGHIDQNGTESIPVVTLDEVITDRPTFIKMDIEGAEMSALKGASTIIRESRPRLAICVYHKPEDLFEIMELIESWQVHYNYYFRHYTKGISGTILYCIPQCDGE